MLSRTAALTFVALVVWLHIVRRDISPRERGLSRYAEGRTLMPMTLAFFALAAALAAAAWQLESWLFTTACLSMVAIAATPKPRESRTITGAVHTIAGFVFFVSAAAAANAWSPHGPRKIAAWLLALATSVFIAAILGVRGLRGSGGLCQRLTFALLVIWLMLPA